MGLILKKDVEQNPTGTELYIEVVQTTGTYHATENPGGFGTPNVERANVALIFYGNHKKVDGNVLATPLAHNPLTVESFTIALTRENNGILEFYVWPVDLFDSEGVYENGDIVYDNEAPATPFIKKMISDVWTVLTPADLLNEDIDGSIIAANTFPFPDATKYRNKLNADRTKLGVQLEDDEITQEDYDPIKNRFDTVDGLLEVATQAFCGGAYNEAQKNLEKIFEIEDATSDTNG